MIAIILALLAIAVADDAVARLRLAHLRRTNRTFAAAIQPAEQAKARARLLRWCGTQHIGGPRP